MQSSLPWVVISPIQVPPGLRMPWPGHNRPKDGVASARRKWMPGASRGTTSLATIIRSNLERDPAIFAVAEACFLQIEIAFDPPPRLVGDLAVAQQDVDEFPLG
jgi:hypothetical protein